MPVGIGNGNVVTITPPSADLLTTDDLRRQRNLPLDYRGNETELQLYIDAAIYTAQRETRRQFLNATLALTMDCFPSSVLYVPRPPLVSVTSIAYIDTAGDSQTLATSVYEADTASDPGRIWLKDGQTWPDTQPGIGKVTITYVAGYGSSAASVPALFRQAVLLMAAHWEKLREPVVVGTIATKVPSQFEYLLGLGRHGRLM